MEYQDTSLESQLFVFIVEKQNCHQFDLNCVMIISIMKELENLNPPPQQPYNYRLTVVVFSVV